MLKYYPIIAGKDNTITNKQYNYFITDTAGKKLYSCPTVYRSQLHLETASLLYCFDNYPTTKTIINIY